MSKSARVREREPEPQPTGNYVTHPTRITERARSAQRVIRQEMLRRGTASSKTGLVRLDYAGINEHALLLLARMEEIDVRA